MQNGAWNCRYYLILNNKKINSLYLNVALNISRKFKLIKGSLVLSACVGKQIQVVKCFT